MNGDNCMRILGEKQDNNPKHTARGKILWVISEIEND